MQMAVTDGHPCPLLTRVGMGVASQVSGNVCDVVTATWSLWAGVDFILLPKRIVKPKTA
jgi:hypothetical protein